MEDAIELHKAFKFIGCDTAAVVSVLSRRNAAQRSLILRQYIAMYGCDLICRLKSKLRFTPNVKMAVVTWMLEGQAREAYVTRKWMEEGSYLRSSQYVASLSVFATGRASHVICSRIQSEIPFFKQLYYSLNGATLEIHIKIHTTSSLRKLLTEHVSTLGREGQQAQTHVAENDARLLYEAGAKRWFTDRDAFIMVFTRRSAAQLVAVSEAYARAYGRTLEKAIRRATPDIFGDALITILKCAYSRISYFAEVLRKAMIVYDSSTLTWVIVTRAEIDLQDIKAEYFRRFSRNLRQDVYSKTSGNYRAFLLHLIGPT